ncbi:hypothetical protein ACFSSC_09730 [Corynebacterium mendelii]|uniref:hypothetical protein n=1 Tax=Corynebacterium mendelii TaxID=2765362 RepID=UPI001F5DE562|nr:hypothetical protein [Corynebacterium mendelii]
MKDNLLIDAYERAYMVAQAVGADGREPEIPPMRDRLTMARRVRGYVVNGKPSRTQRTVERQSSAGRKALATMGRKGGKKAAQRLKTDPQGEYAQLQKTRLAKANERKKLEAQGEKLTIAGWFLRVYTETGTWPTIATAMNEYNVSRATVKRALQAANITLPRGRKAQPK